MTVQHEPNLVHHCHAEGCPKRVPPRLLFCLAHWKLVPKKLQELVWKVYAPQQEVTKRVTREYVWVQRTCVALVAMREGKINEASSIIVDLTVMLTHVGAPDLRAAVQNWIDKLVAEIRNGSEQQLEFLPSKIEEGHAVYSSPAHPGKDIHFYPHEEDLHDERQALAQEPAPVEGLREAASQAAAAVQACAPHGAHAESLLRAAAPQGQGQAQAPEALPIKAWF